MSERGMKPDLDISSESRREDERKDLGENRVRDGGDGRKGRGRLRVNGVSEVK